MCFLGPEQGTFKDPIVFQRILYFIYLFIFFAQNACIFHCLDIPQNSPNLEYKSHLVKYFVIYCRPEFPPLGGAECVLANNSHILSCTFKNLISTHSVNCAESSGKGHPISAYHFFSLLRKMSKTYFFLPGDFTDLVQNRKCCISRQWCIQMTLNLGHYFNMSPWGSLQNFRRWPQGGSL